MHRLAAIVCVLSMGCGGAAKSATETGHRATPAADAGTGGPPAEPAPEPVEPWPKAKSGAAWTVVEWTMTEREASDALTGAGFAPQARTDSAGGRVEALDVVSSLSGWKASIAFDAKTKNVATVTVRGDPATIPQARAERANLEERFGPPVETHVHWSKQFANDRASSGKKSAPPPAKKAAPTPPPKGGKLVEVGFKKDDQHVRLGILEKAGLQQVAVGQDVADRKAAERRANDAIGSLGSCLSEAETESSAFRDATADVRLSITGFQGQRVVFESYRNPAADGAKQP